MKLLALLLALGCWLAATQARAEVPVKMDKTKTAILPSGGFYSLYEAACPDGSSTEVASMRRGLRWCTARSGELVCFRRPAEVLELACASNQLAASDPGQAAPDS